MFGYCRPHVPALTVAEHSFYKSVYCGLCHTMSHTTCKASGLTLSYDFVFLTLVRAAMTNTSFSLTKRRCAAHPQRKEYAADANEALRYAAAASAVLTYYNVLDDIQDGRKSAKLLLPTAKRMYEKGKDACPDKEIRARLEELSAIEREKTPSCDAPASAFGALLGAVFAYGMEGTDVELAEKIGSLCGRWIYFADAVDDYDSDKKSGSYNPLLCAPDLAGESETDKRTRVRGDAVTAMHLLAAELWEAIDRIDCGERRMMRAIIENIVSVSMPRQAERMLHDLPKDGTTKEREVLLPTGGDVTALYQS